MVRIYDDASRNDYNRMREDPTAGSGVIAGAVMQVQLL